MAGDKRRENAAGRGRREDIRRTASIVSSYALNNTLPVGELARLIGSVHAKLRDFRSPPPVEAAAAVPIAKSVAPDYVVCLECGAKHRTLKRHIGLLHGLDADAYRERWNLPRTYPLIAPNYAAVRSRLARELGLGRRPRNRRLT